MSPSTKRRRAPRKRQPFKRLFSRLGERYWLILTIIALAIALTIIVVTAGSLSVFLKAAVPFPAPRGGVWISGDMEVLGGSVEGWACDNNNPSATVIVMLWRSSASAPGADGTDPSRVKVAEGPANQAPLRAGHSLFAGSCPGNHSFRFAVPAPGSGEELTMNARTDGSSIITYNIDHIYNLLPGGSTVPSSSPSRRPSPTPRRPQPPVPPPATTLAPTTPPCPTAAPLSWLGTIRRLMAQAVPTEPPCPLPTTKPTATPTPSRRPPVPAPTTTPGICHQHRIDPCSAPVGKPVDCRGGTQGNIPSKELCCRVVKADFGPLSTVWHRQTGLQTALTGMTCPAGCYGSGHGWRGKLARERAMAAVDRCLARERIRCERSGRQFRTGASDQEFSGAPIVPGYSVSLSQEYYCER